MERERERDLHREEYRGYGVCSSDARTDVEATRLIVEEERKREKSDLRGRTRRSIKLRHLKKFRKCNDVLKCASMRCAH